MKKMKMLGSVVVACLAMSGAQAEAASITCPNIGATPTPDRQFTLGDAVGCYYGNADNPDATLIANTVVGGTVAADWEKEGELTSAGSNDLFIVTVTSGSFGSVPVGGTWSIASSFWHTYDRAIISVHVGQGSGNPDWWLFDILPGATSGTWDYTRLTGQGGGLSNMKLWGTGDPYCTDNGCGDETIPEPTTLALFGLGLLGAGIARRRLK